MPATLDVVTIPGDGIGPEVMSAVRAVLDAAEAPLTCHDHLAGESALAAGGAVLPDATIDAVRAHGLALKGPCTTPVGKGFRSVNVQLRQTLDLYAAVRPVRSIDGVPTPYEDVDLVIFRENTEGLYSGVEDEIKPGLITTLKIVSREASERIARAALAYVEHRGRRKLTVFHKANIMKRSDGLFLECVEKVHAEEFPDVTVDTVIIDAGCMRLVQDPSQFDVMVMENFYGDVVSDLTAGLVGGLGVVPGANVGKRVAVFEAVHGSAPDIAGRGVANPLALLMSAVMMLNHVREHGLGGEAIAAACGASAERIKRGYNAALHDGQKTRDLGGELGTEAFARAVIDRLS
ncbi:MAG: isocitrate/isopropylmalate dehydrogenase family protein [Planctomycetota bacterium]